MPPVNLSNSNPLNMGPSPEIGGIPKSNNRAVPVEKQMVTVYDPNGDAHEVLRQNANDLVRHAGWSRAPKAPVAQEVVEDGESGSSKAKQAEADNTALENAMDALNNLRAEAAAVGVDVDSRWGKKRLVEEIEKANKKSEGTK